VSLDQIAKVTGQDTTRCQTAIDELAKLLSKTSLEIRSFTKGIMLVTKPEYSDIIGRLENAKKPQLSSTSLEVLSIVAYHQPITKTQIDEFRGVQSENTLDNLRELGLIEQSIQTRDSQPDSYWNTTEQFLLLFGIDSIADLPRLTETKKMRINQALVQLGFATSRRKADDLLIAGRVKCNGQKVEHLATIVDIHQDTITVDDQAAEPIIQATIIMNKPVGYVCSHQPQGNDKSVFELLPPQYQQLKLAGRLDKDSEGLLLLSSDGNLINQLSHPRHNKQKTYYLVLDEPIVASAINKLLHGVALEDGISKFDKVEGRGRELTVVIHEGRNRQIRRTLQALGYKVTKLQRVSLGDYKLGQLKPGDWQKIATITP
jgi:segregation and condensation protein B